MAPRALLVGLLALLGACNATSRQTFDEAATLFVDDLRWGRLHTAETLVEPAVREAFVRRHRPWGVSVHLVDVEVESMRANAEEGTARLKVIWTPGPDSAEVRETLVEETWRLTSGGWRLRGESVLAGDASIFAAETAAPTPAAAPATARAPGATPPG